LPLNLSRGESGGRLGHRGYGSQRTFFIGVSETNIPKLGKDLVSQRKALRKKLEHRRGKERCQKEMGQEVF